MLLSLLYILPQAVYTFRVQSWLIRGVERTIEGIVLLPSISKKSLAKAIEKSSSLSTRFYYHQHYKYWTTIGDTSATGRHGLIE